MAVTPKLSLTYPNKNDKNWFSKFDAFADALDLSLYSRAEDLNIIISGGGDVSWDGSTLSWSAQIDLFSPIVGYNWYIPPGSLDVSDGRIAYVILLRAPSANTEVSLLAADNLSSVHTNVGLLICQNKGGTLYFRNGRNIASGETFPLLQQSSQGGGGSSLGESGQVLVQHIAMATNEATSNAAPRVVGMLYFNPADYVITGTTLTVDFKAIGSVTHGDATLSVTLYNLTDAVVESSVDMTNTTPQEHLQTFTADNSDDLYEVRIELSDGAPTYTGNLWWAGLVVRNTID